jgi:hypothetical protein
MIPIPSCSFHRIISFLPTNLRLKIHTVGRAHIALNLSSVAGNRFARTDIYFTPPLPTPNWSQTYSDMVVVQATFNHFSFRWLSYCIHRNTSNTSYYFCRIASLEFIRFPCVKDDFVLVFDATFIRMSRNELAGGDCTSPIPPPYQFRPAK